VTKIGTTAANQNFIHDEDKKFRLILFETWMLGRIFELNRENVTGELRDFKTHSHALPIIKYYAY
jgi:hypothetical protein